MAVHREALDASIAAIRECRLRAIMALSCRVVEAAGVEGHVGAFSN
jgi:hypothetical protein